MGDKFAKYDRDAAIKVLILVCVEVSVGVVDKYNNYINIVES